MHALKRNMEFKIKISNTRKQQTYTKKVLESKTLLS